MWLWAVYLALINAATFAAFAADKRRAIEGLRRIPERRLLTLAAIGGGLGAVAAQRMLRHKTRKQPFRSLLWLVLAVQLVVIALLVLGRSGQG